MHEENPGVDLYRENLYIVDSGRNAAKMKDVVERMAGLTRKLLAGEDIGLPAEEGYLARGLIRDRFVDKSSAERLVDMVLAKAQGQPFDTEMPVTSFEPVARPRGVDDLSKAKVMLITDGGLVPKGNPDNIEGMAATRWGAYNISGADDLAGEDYEISHGGYDPRFVQADPDRLVPLDALRQLEKEGAVGKIHGEFLSTSGLSNPLSNTRRLGREMAEKVKREGVERRHPHLHVRHQHSQRRCDHHRVGKGRRPRRADDLRPTHRKDGGLQPCRAWSRHRPRGRRRKPAGGRGKGAAPETGRGGVGFAEGRGEHRLTRGLEAHDYTVGFVAQEVDIAVRPHPYVPDTADGPLQHPLFAHHSFSIQLEPRQQAEPERAHQ